MDSANDIPTSELIADWQTSMTEILFISMMPPEMQIDYSDRLEGNEAIVDSIEKIMRKRFDSETLRKFLDKGYPRATAAR